MSVRKNARRWALGGIVLGAMLGLVACFGGEGSDLLIDVNESPSPSPAGSPTATSFGSPTGLGSPSPAGTTTPGGTTPPAGITPVGPFLVEIDSEKQFEGEPVTAVRVRNAPCTAETDTCRVLDQIYLGEKHCVTGQARGEEAEPGNHKWYALEEGGFVYSGFFIKGGDCP